MLYLFKIALRNLSRNKFRSFISILAIAVVVAIVIFARGLLLGFTESSFSLVVDNQYGHVRITDQEYRAREMLLTLDHTVDGFQGQGLSAMLDEIREVEGVEYLLPRLKFGAMASPGDDIIRMAGIGIDPRLEEQHGALSGDITEGRMVEQGREIIVGKGLREKLGAEIGERVTILFSDAYQSFQGRTFTIVGIRETGVPMLDDSLFYLPLPEAQHMLYLEDEATEIMVFGSRLREADQLKNNITGLFAARSGEEKYSVLAWDEADPLIEYLQVGVRIYDIIYVFIILLGAIVLINTMIMITRERTAEIGMMGALGLKSREILQIFTLEGAVMGVLGSLLGVIPGGAITYYFSQVGLDYYADMLEDIDVMMAPEIYPVFSLENLVISFILGAVITSLVSIWPARKAANLEPVDALHREI